jgi:hypothetical protein
MLSLADLWRYRRCHPAQRAHLSKLERALINAQAAHHLAEKAQHLAISAAADLDQAIAQGINDQPAHRSDSTKRIMAAATYLSKSKLSAETAYQTLTKQVFLTRKALSQVTIRNQPQEQQP